MKIIQSYAQLNNDGHQYVGNSLNGNEVYLNLYTFLLSYLTLKNYYGSVTMYCNRLAYNTFLRHVPYDEIVFVENVHNSPLFWSYYKVQIMNSMNEDFVHVDSDVFLFDDLLRPFLNGEYDGIVQDLIPANNNFTKGFVDANFFKLPKYYDRKCYSCGVIGMTKKVQTEYLKQNIELYNKIVAGEFEGLQENRNIYCGIVEELGFYLTCLGNNYKIYEILPHNLILGGDQRSAGNAHKYTHMWGGTKYMARHIERIKKKIKTLFPESYHLVEQYDAIIGMKEVKML